MEYWHILSHDLCLLLLVRKGICLYMPPIDKGFSYGAFPWLFRGRFGGSVDDRKNDPSLSILSQWIKRLTSANIPSWIVPAKPACERSFRKLNDNVP